MPPLYEIIKNETVARVYRVEAEDDTEALSKVDNYDIQPTKTFTIDEHTESVEEIDEVQEALDSLTSEQYEILSAEIERLRARIAELEAK